MSENNIEISLEFQNKSIIIGEHYTVYLSFKCKGNTEFFRFCKKKKKDRTQVTSWKKWRSYKQLKNERFMKT